MGPRVVKRFLRLPAVDRILLLRSVLWLGAARLAVWLLPFRLVRQLLARPARAPSSEAVTTERIAWAMGLARRVMPRTTCLPQALAAEALLTRSGLPAKLRIGVVKTDMGRLEAHAWVESGGRIVVGDLHEGHSRFTPLPPLPGAEV